MSGMFNFDTGAMSQLGAGMNVASGVTDMIGNMVNYIGGQIQNVENLKFAREQYDYQKELNNKLMEREDNAIQRRVQDMQKAGLNPVLSAGSPASASAGQSAPAPQGKWEKMQSMLAIASAMEQNKQLAEQIATERETRKGIALDNNLKPVILARTLQELENVKKDGVYKDLEIISKRLDNIEKGIEAGKTSQTGISNKGGPLGYIREARYRLGLVNDKFAREESKYTDYEKRSKTKNPFKWLGEQVKHHQQVKNDFWLGAMGM